MLTFSEFLASQRNDQVPAMPQLDPTTAASFSSPGREDTRRALERAKKLGRPATPDDIKASISPESHERAKQGVMALSVEPDMRVAARTNRAAGPL